MKIKSCIQNPSGKRVEMTADKDIYLKTFTQVHSSGPWIEFAIDDCSLWDFLYYLYLDLISGYMDKPEFADEKTRKEYEALSEQLKDNIIDADSLTLLRDTLLKLMDACPETPVFRPKVKKLGHNIETYSVEDALGKYHDLAVEALGCCDNAKYVNPYRTESTGTIIAGYDEADDIELVYSLPKLSYRCCALAELEDMGVLESKWIENDGKDGKSALYRHILELSAQSDKFDDKTLYLLDLAARCLEPFVTGQIHRKQPREVYTDPEKRIEKLQRLFDSFEEDIDNHTTTEEQ